MLHFFYVLVNSRLPVRVLLYTWCLVTIVLVNAYSSILTSVLMTPRYHLMAESVEDIAKIQRPVFMASNYSANAKVALVYIYCLVALAKLLKPYF